MLIKLEHKINSHNPTKIFKSLTVYYVIYPCTTVQHALKPSVSWSNHVIAINHFNKHVVSSFNKEETHSVDLKCDIMTPSLNWGWVVDIVYSRLWI